MKEEILNYVTMENVLDKYGIEHRHGMFSCPFHGEDRRPSAKAYKNSFYCFACNKMGDIIEFVEELFNLSFKEAMQKINIDFNLGLDNKNVDYEKLRQIKNIQNEKKKKKQELKNRYIYLCKLKDEYCYIIDNLKSNITCKNWESMREVICFCEIKTILIDQELDEIDNKLSSRT